MMAKASQVPMSYEIIPSKQAASGFFDHIDHYLIQGRFVVYACSWIDCPFSANAFIVIESQFFMDRI
jgi:hypothetical protein